MAEVKRPWVPAARLLLLVVLVVPAGGQACPRSCNCYQASEVHCTFRSLLNIPPGLPAHTRRINLGFNSISRIQDGSLSGLKKLELLMLHSNDLQLLQDGLFRDMKSLQILKLSYNKLREISSSQTFSGLTSLLRLYLDHNLLEHVHPRALLQLPSLRLLRLQGNRLHQLHPHALCTLSLLNTYYFSTLRHLDLSNNSLTSLHRAALQTAPLLETLVLQANPWSCDCRMGWLLAWNRARPDLMKCPSGPQCPLCSSPSDLQGRGLFEQSELSCSPPVISSPGRDAPSEAELGENQARESFGEPLGTASLGLSDQQGNSIDLSCNITHSSDSRDIFPPPDLSLLSSSPIALTLSLSLECPVEREGYESLWRILAYYSETALHLEREIMLSKAPALAYRYRQTAETEGYYNTGVKVSLKARPHWLLQPAVGIQLNRAQSTASRVGLIVSTRVSAHPDPTSYPSSAASHPWVLISANASALVAVAGSNVELPCPLLSSGNAKVHWVLPDGSRLSSSSRSPDLQVSASGLLVQKVEHSNAGVYYCVAQAGRDVDVLPVRLVVEESSAPLSGEKVGPPFKVTAGQPVSLSCKSSGSPTPEVSWLLPDGNIVKRGVAVSGGVIMQSNGSLSLPSPSLRDAGHYRCVALNQHGGDSLSTQLEVTPRHPPTLRTSYRRGPQSASGRSTKIRAPLLRQVEEGSGDEEEEDERTFVPNRRRQRPLQPPPSRRYPVGKPMRRGQAREGPLRRGGGGRPLVAPDQRRNRFDNRHRVTNNKQRIDPKKWADLLAKIRQKTSPTESSRLVTAGETGESTAEPGRGGQDKDTGRQEEEDNTQRAETEGSSVDDASLQEEGLHPVYPTQTQTPEAEPGRDRENESDSHSESETMETVTQRDPITSKPVSNEIVSEPVEAEERETKPTLSRPRPQKPRQGFSPNLVPESRPKSPWNSRRRIGQGRRILVRQRGRVLTPARPLPDPTNQQSVTPDTSSDQMTTTTTAAKLSTESQRVDSLVSTTSLPSPSVASGSQVSESDPPSPTPSPHASSPPSDTGTHVDLTTHSANIPESAVSDTPATARPGISTTQTSAGTTETHTAPGKHVDGPTSKHGEEPERERNVLDARHVTDSPSPPPDTRPSGSSSITSATPETNHFSTSAEVTTSTSTTATSDDTLLTTTQSTPVTTNIITSTTEKTTLRSTTTTSPTTTTIFTSTAPAILSTSISTPTNSPPTTTSTSTTTFIPTTSIPTTTFKTTSTPITSPSTTTTALHTSSAVTTTVTSSSTRATSMERPSVGRADPRGRPVSGSPNHGRPPTDWKNPGANSIPDSHGSRPQRPPSPPLPAAPGAPVVRSRPRIADPHIRTASFPAESVARLTCEAQGEPKPSITWTKVTTGAVMSIHSRAQRFEVLPNGTLVIQNVQLQDRGTYICSAQSFMGRDRLLTTLEVWTRPPRMQLASYREATIHQGGELHLECQASGVPAPLLSWVLPDRSVLTSSSAATTTPAASRLAMSANGTLHILATSASDRGVYRCVASNSAGAASASVRVHVSSLPPVMQQPKEEHLLLSPGRPVYAQCSARGAPPPTLRWRIPDGTLVRPSQFLHGNLFVLPNGTLHIRKVGPKDSGNYECVASNAVGVDKRTVRVRVDGDVEAGRGAGGPRGPGKEEKVSEKPSSSSSLQKDKNKPGDPSEPHLSARAPPPSPSDGAGTFLPPPSAPPPAPQPPRPNSADSLSPIDRTDAASPERPNTMRVSSLSPPSIVPTNHTLASPGPLNKPTADSSPLLPPPDKGRASPPSPVSPFTKAHIVSTSPSISTVSYGGDLHLHCSVSGNPTPIIIWRTPNRKLVDMHFSFDRRLTVQPNGTLTVRAVTEKDVGDYLCIARNKVADDYRLLRVSVVTKPAKIEPKQPLDQMVSLGKPLKVDCLASGLPDPAVRWSLPDGTMVNSVLQGEDRGGRTRRLTVFDNGTLLVPAVGMKEQGEYTCYAENQGGQDMMKVNVKIMMTSPPTFTDDRSFHVLKVRQGETAAIRCQVRGDPIPAVMWFSPSHRVIPRSSGSGLYSERVVVVPGGSLEVRQAQRIDTGNYTCRAINSAGERSMVVGLEVEGHGQGGPVAGRGWNGFTGRNANTIGSNNDVWTRNAVPGNGINPAAGGGVNPPVRSETLNGFNRPVGGIATQSGSVISVGVDGGRNVGFKVDNSGINRNTPSVPSSTNRVSTSQNTGSVARSNNNEVTAGKPHNDSSTGRENGRISGVAADVFRGSAANNGAGAAGGNWVNAGASRAAVTSAGGKHSVVGVVTTVKQQAVKGQTVVLPCPSTGSPPPRLAWLLPGNGVLPAPYYGSRLTVHRNGSLELRGVRASDTGTLVCVVRGERGETRIQVELEVAEAQEGGGPPADRPKTPVSSQSRLVETPQQRATVTEGPAPQAPSAPRLTSTGPVKQPVVSTHTAALVSIINGETLRLPCPQTPAHPQGPLSWTLPGGKVVPRGESGDSGRYFVQPDGTLVVQRASVFDRGTYTCRSASYDSSSVSVSMVPVIVIAYPPRITTGPSPVTYTRPGVAVELPCLTIATPRATVTWETPDLTQLRVMGQARIYGNRYLSPQGSLVIQNPTIRDTGFYRCTAKNVIGVDTKATYLHVI